METKPTQDTERKDRRQETQCWREILSGALAYQPETPMAEKSVPIVEETFIGQKTVDMNFIIDQFASREVVLQLDLDHNGYVQISLDNVVLEDAFDTAVEEVYQNKNLNLSLGLHNLTVTSTSAMTALSVKVIGNVPDIFHLVMGRIFVLLKGSYHKKSFFCQNLIFWIVSKI